ncbi:hypothetical protein HX787_29340 [Pseudomonas tolaasii]|uniref:Uncharacterized protein n=2 Tax=Pseudomonas tolaasii TaxID=29442 RepID=A0A7Y8AUB8_PSETO|nr:hypothetical protein [Pseudomonas tolaasii]ARB30283.1 hypothetical protein B5P22_24345 [Pseudomonas tolaasii]KAB0467406.1 hypothetical protein F7R12_24780 [Pseudomonas tolaasii]MBY8944079.1 hypothetical protein [Pseudomonas tolaasii]NWC21705.1 hypothetical protein [Pseudomonas tolaasii]NWC42587.1 hypothetical protein [Pseudomonas tolaasii]
MLKHPFLNIPYLPKLQYFLGGFDIYGREDSLGAAIATYDINLPKDRAYLIKHLIIDRDSDLSYRHKKCLMDALSAALDNNEYNFSKFLHQDLNSHCSLPCGWDRMDNPRSFFEDIFKLANEGWRDDLEKASLEDQSTW